MTYKQEPADPEQGTKPETEIIAYATPATTSTFTPTTEHTPPAAVTTASVDTPMHSQTKQGSKCCGCCCDYRRAVIILNFVLGILGIISLIVISDGSPAIGQQEFDLDDDSLVNIVEDTYRQQAILVGVGVFASIVAIVGAYSYNIYMVGFNIIYMTVSFIATTVLTNKAFNILEEDYNGDDGIPGPIWYYVIQGVLLCVYIHPHVGFMSEVKAAILSAETYPREEYCCCGVQRRPA
jgi:hypothetical protein